MSRRLSKITQIYKRHLSELSLNTTTSLLTRSCSSYSTLCSKEMTKTQHVLQEGRQQTSQTHLEVGQ